MTNGYKKHKDWDVKWTSGNYFNDKKDVSFKHQGLKIKEIIS